MYLFHGTESCLPAAVLQKCIDFLHSDELPDIGEKAEMNDGIYCIVNQYMTVIENESFWEAHRKYVDVHCVLKGEEKIRVACTEQGKLGKYYPEMDYQEVEGEAIAELILREGFLLCLFPNDAHQVKLQVCNGEEKNVTKVVFKIPMELF